MNSPASDAEDPLIRDHMSKSVVTVPDSEMVDHAAQVMVERGVGSAIVVEGGQLRGIITERDVLRAVARGLIPWTTPVAECMTRDPLTANPLSSCSSALTTMMERGFRHLPVVEEGSLVGIISLRDLVSTEAPPSA